MMKGIVNSDNNKPTGIPLSGSLWKPEFHFWAINNFIILYSIFYLHCGSIVKKTIDVSRALYLEKCNFLQKLNY